MSEETKLNNKLKFSFKREWPILLLLMGSLIYGIYVLPDLPERVPSHWNMSGEIDGWSTPFWGAFGLPLLNLGLYFLMLILPKIDPNKERYAKFIGAYNAFRFTFHTFFVGMFAVVIMAAKGIDVDVDRVIPMGISILFLVIGNYMGKLRKNYFFGIRSPWTLASEEVWQKTHRMAGPIWVVASLISFVGSFFGGKTAFVTFFSALIFATLFPMIYSYFVYRKLDSK